jgi:hypothetical protein
MSCWWSVMKEMRLKRFEEEGKKKTDSRLHAYQYESM